MKLHTSFFVHLAYLSANVLQNLTSIQATVEEKEGWPGEIHLGWVLHIGILTFKKSFGGVKHLKEIQFFFSLLVFICPETVPNLSMAADMV
jgi:hypothetical protein